MAAENHEFPWLSYYKNYKFFEGCIDKHSQIVSVQKISLGLYNISLNGGKKLKVFICECYSFGVAEYIETNEKISGLNIIIINSNWCGYSNEAKEISVENKIGLFSIRGFMAAINKNNYWEYMTKEEKEQKKL